MTKDTVFVSGATGFIATHTVKDLLEHGYSVIGSVRSSEKGDRLKKLLKSDKFDYEVVADIGEKGAFDEALKKHPEVTVFLHTASPFHFKATDPEKELLKPAVEGTKNALSAIKAHGKNVQKVVVTSSYAAIMTLGNQDPNKVDDEDTWNPITWEETCANPVAGYIGSKKFAEKEAWDFLKNEKPQFSLSTVNPVYVFGPQAFVEDVKGTLNTSAEIINSVLSWKKESDIVDYKGAFIDVRDVARAHREAFELAEAKDQRFLMSNGQFTSQLILDLLHEKLPNESKEIPKGNPGSQVEDIKKMGKINNEKTQKLLGFKFISLEQSVLDSIQQILDARK